MESSRICTYSRVMAYDEKGRPIVDGKPFDEFEYTEDSFLAGLNLDGHEVHLAFLRRLKARAERNMAADEVFRLENEIEEAIRNAPSEVCKVCGQAKFGRRLCAERWESLCEDHMNEVDADVERARLAKLDPLRRALGKSRKQKLHLSPEISDALDKLWPALQHIYDDLPGFESTTISSATWRPPIFRFQVESKHRDGRPAQCWRLDLEKGTTRCDFRYAAGTKALGGSRITAAGGKL